MLHSSSEYLREFSRKSTCGDPGFERILVFDFYDGPERGLATFPSGCGARFSSLGDSSSRFFRAFEIVSIEGAWRARLDTLQNPWPPRRLMIPAEASDLLAQLEKDVASAPAIDFFIGVGSSYLEEMSIVQVDEQQLGHLTRIDTWPECFRATHHLIKKIRRQSDY